MTTGGTTRWRRVVGRFALALALAILVLVAAGAVFLYQPALAGSAAHRPPLPGLRRPLVFAHRGGAGEGPEATLPTILATARQLPDAVIELDVRRSADGHIVVIHDATVDRTTNGFGRVDALSLAQLRALDAGHCATPGVGRGTARREACADRTRTAAFPMRGKGYRIPTLGEVLRALPATTVVGIEVKAAGFEAQLAAELRASDRLARLVVGSAHDEVAARLATLLPEVPRYFPKYGVARLALGARLGVSRFVRPRHHVLAIPRAFGAVRFDQPGFIALAHQLGILVAYFTIDDAGDIEELFRRGADAVITDYPARAEAVAARLRASL